MKSTTGTITRKGFFAALSGAAVATAAEVKTATQENRSPDAVLWTEYATDDGRVSFIGVTPGAEKILGMNPEEAVRRFGPTPGAVAHNGAVWAVTRYPQIGFLRFTSMVKVIG